MRMNCFLFIVKTLSISLLNKLAVPSKRTICQSDSLKASFSAHTPPKTIKKVTKATTHRSNVSVVALPSLYRSLRLFPTFFCTNREGSSGGLGKPVFDNLMITCLSSAPQVVTGTLPVRFHRHLRARFFAA